VEPEADISPARIGGFRVLRRLSSGATTDVLLARAEGPHGFERVVALKVLLQQYRSDPSFERMFAREASAYARLSHPAIVKLYDFFSTDGQLVMVLEYVDGLPLHKLRAMLSIGGERFEDSAALFIGSRIFAGLGAAHSARDPENGEFSPVIHRDINPSNVLVPWDGHVKINDFGIAMIGGTQGDTRLGFVKGTYGYMAPEQVRGETVTVRADVYAASLVLWELLARRKAIQRGALPEVEVLKAMAEPQIPSLDTLRPDLPAEIRDAVRRGLEPDADRRGISADEMAAVLRLATKGDEGRARLAEAIARVRPPAPESELAVTKAHPTLPASLPVSPRRESLAATLERDPDETAKLSRQSVPDDSGAFKRAEIAVDAAWSAPADSVPEPPGSSEDLTVVEARRPGTSDVPPTLPPSSEPGTIPPRTLPLPHSAPPSGWRQPAQGFVRASATAEQPHTLRFGRSEPPPTTENPAPTPVVPASPGIPGGVTLESQGPTSAPLSKPTIISAVPPPPPESRRNPRTPPRPATPPKGVERVEAPRPRAPEPSLPRFPMLSVDSLPPPVPLPELSPAVAPPVAPLVAAPPPAPGVAPAILGPGVTTATHERALAAARPTIPTVRRSSRVGLLLAVVVGSALLGVGGVELYLRLRAPADTPIEARVGTTPTTSSASAPVTPPAAAPPATPTAAPARSAQPQPKASTSSLPAVAPPPVGAAPAASPAPAASASPKPPADPTPTPAGTDPHAAAAGTGDILTKASAGGHRIYVDDRVVGNSPDPVRVRCGKHTVRVGSAGTPREVEVPCGGSVVVTP